MEVKEKNLQQQVQFWALVGPFISLLTILVSFMKYSPMQYAFASVMVVAIPICWKWRMRGFAISMGILMAIVAYQFIDMSFDQRIWVGGISLAFSLSLLSTALSFEEISCLMDSMQVESKSRLENMLRLDEKFKKVSDEYQDEERLLKGQMQELEREIVQYKNRVTASEKLAQVVREELALTHKRNEEISQELYDTRAKGLQSERKIKELECQIEEIISSAQNPLEVEKLQNELSALKECLAKKEDDLGLLELQIEYHEKELQSKDKILSDKSEKVQKLENTIKQLEDTIVEFKSLQEESAIRTDEEKVQLSQELAESQETVAKLQQHLKDYQEELQSLKLTVKEKDQEFVVHCQTLEDEQQRAAEQELVLHKLLEEAKSDRERLMGEYKEIESQLTAKSAELEALKQELKDQPAKDETVKKGAKKETSALRQAEGRYKQLKQQFDEKSLVLDETRRALFHMQEDLLNLQRESEERKITEKSDVVSALEQHIKKMEEERKQLEIEHQQEIDDLHEIVASLSSRKN